MKKFILLFLLFFFKPTIAQTYVLIPDIYFMVYLQNTFPSAMSGWSLDITNTLVTTTQILDVSSQSITSLEGVQYFTSLDQLNCPWNSLTSLPVLPNSLQYLNCYNNSLISLPILPSSLKSLACSYNNLISLPILPNSLQSLNCAYNQLTYLPALPNYLAGLVCNRNNISCFPTFPEYMCGFNINNNPFTCLPNYVSIMTSSLLAFPICTAGNSNSCPDGIIGIKEESNPVQSLKIFPNPANSIINVECLTYNQYYSNLKIQIENTFGQIVFTDKINSERSSYNISHLQNGIYFIRIGSVVKKIIKE